MQIFLCFLLKYLRISRILRKFAAQIAHVLHIRTKKAEYEKDYLDSLRSDDDAQHSGGKRVVQ